MILSWRRRYGPSFGGTGRWGLLLTSLGRRVHDTPSHSFCWLLTKPKLLTFRPPPPKCARGPFEVHYWLTARAGDPPPITPCKEHTLSSRNARAWQPGSGVGGSPRRGCQGKRRRCRREPGITGHRLTLSSFFLSPKCQGKTTPHSNCLCANEGSWYFLYSCRQIKRPSPTAVLPWLAGGTGSRLV